MTWGTTRTSGCELGHERQRGSILAARGGVRSNYAGGIRWTEDGCGGSAIRPAITGREDVESDAASGGIAVDHTVYAAADPYSQRLKPDQQLGVW